MAWLLFYGDWPTAQVDHIDGDRANNRICNLRDATHSDNCRNAGLSKRNKSGRIGVHFDHTRQRWVAGTKIMGKPIRLGRFATFEEACAARSAIEREYNFHPNHGRKAQS
ncbi:MAG: HNH endonuclease signature motif containing protein [Blastomonas fulva]|uniref:HNH endonuclease signature motif containing protein n=1 Tax=Blastomonas fulva TaxID=1550728 RepID=UPI00403330DA